jgi:hypothetical protein
MASAAACQSCHAGLQGEAGDLYMPWDTWAGSMMANAARDPLFLASLSVAEHDHPGAGTTCLRCHTPSAFVESRATPGDGSALSDVDREGVQCAVCHRSVDASTAPTSPDPNAPYVGDAQLFFDLGMPTEATYHGPYDDPGSSPAHHTVGDPFARDDSRLCGQCHQVDSPTEDLHDAAGADTGKPFPLDTTYEEWHHSAYASGTSARSCASCHMPAEAGMAPVATGAADRVDPPRHDFVGGNEWGPALLKAAFPGLRDDAYDRTRAAAQASLQAAAKLEIRSLPGEGDAGGSVPLTVRVTNLSGHKFPTGYADGRRAWLEVSVTSEGSPTDVQSGAYDDATGELGSDGQLRVYEAVHGRDGSPEDHIALHQQILRDSRIPPLGFQPTATTAPVGPISFSNGAGGFVPYDDASFLVKLPTGQGQPQVTVRVRLLYQAVTASHVAALAAADTGDGRGATLQALWQATGKAAPFVMAEVSQLVQLRDMKTTTITTDTDNGHGCSCATAPAGRGRGRGPGAGAGTGLALGAALAGLVSRRRRRRTRGRAATTSRDCCRRPPRSAP